MPRIWFITGTDTDVGKTVLTLLLARVLESRGASYVALKPFCSGGRNDAEQLYRVQEKRLTLDQINPWHYSQPVTPAWAARSSGKKVVCKDVLGWVRGIRPRSEHLLIEGAGGLLSPLGEDFGARELIVGLRAIPLVVCRNRLGAINQARLVFAALPSGSAARARLILMDPHEPDCSTGSNPEVLAQFLGGHRIHRLPWLSMGPWQSMALDLQERVLNLLDP